MNAPRKLLLVVALSVALQAPAQIWEKYYPAFDFQEITEAHDDSLKILACSLSADRAFYGINSQNGSLGNVQAAGLCLATSTFDGGTVEIATIQTPNSMNDVQITKKNSNDSILWQQVFGDTLNDFPLDLLQTRDSGFVIVARHLTNPWTDYYANIQIIRLDLNGDLLWQQYYDLEYDLYWNYTDIQESRHDGSLVFYYDFPISSINIQETRFIALNAAGSIKFGKTFGAQQDGKYHIISAIGTTWGGVMVKYSINNITPHGFGFYEEYEKTYNQIGQNTNNPKYSVIGQAMTNGSTIYCKNDADTFQIAWINATGVVLRKNTFQGTASDVVYTPSGDIFVAGQKFGNPIGQAWLMKLDTLFRRPIVAGRVFWDKNQNCQFDPGEEGLGNCNVSVKNAFTNYSLRTDTTGMFHFQASPDSATLLYVSLQNGNWNACTDSFALSLNNVLDSTWMDIPVQIYDTCSSVQVNLGAKLLTYNSGLGGNVYDIIVSNEGVFPVKNAVLNLTLDDQLEPGANWPFTTTGANTYEWHLGTLSPLQTLRLNAGVILSGAAQDHIFCSELALTATEGACPNTHFNDKDCQNLYPGWSLSNLHSALPVGETDQHFITDDTTIDHKFNLYTTNAGAWGGAILYDTLSPYIDSSSFMLGASSHLCQAAMLNDSVMQITFPQITNVVQSGFFYAFPVDAYVKYQIKPKLGTPIGTVITSRAGVHYTNGIQTFNTLFHTISNAVFSHQNHQLCAGDWFDATQIFQDTLLVDTFPLVGQDSVVFHHLSVFPNYQMNFNLLINEGDSVAVGSHFYHDTGIYLDTLATVHGCDSIITLNLQVFPVDTTQVGLEICQGDASPLTGSSFPNEGVFTETATLSNFLGLDSVVIATVTVHPVEFLEIDSGPFPYGTAYQGVVLTQDTQIVFYDTTAFGCLVTITENVSVLPSSVFESGNSKLLMLLPNPCENYFLVETKDWPGKKQVLKIVDSLGKTVFQNELTVGQVHGKTQCRIDASAWPNGIFYVQLLSEDGILAIKKLIKLE